MVMALLSMPGRGTLVGLTHEDTNHPLAVIIGSHSFR
jgi:hypothetical protein